MANSADPDQLASSEANWSGSTLFAKEGYIRVQQDKGKRSIEKLAGHGGSVGCASDWWSSGDCGFGPRRVSNILSWRFDHEIFSTVILSLPLIQKVQLSVSGEKNVPNTGYITA